jgi:hypothetical protein
MFKKNVIIVVGWLEESVRKYWGHHSPKVYKNCFTLDTKNLKLWKKFSATTPSVAISDISIENRKIFITLKTLQMTTSSHPGVVSDPEYR